MKKKLAVIIIAFLMILLLLLLLFLIPGCTRQNYTIKVYRTNWDLVNETTDETTSPYEKIGIINANTSITYYYYVKKIINYSDTSIRFINSAGKEQSISADRIEIIRDGE